MKIHRVKNQNHNKVECKIHIGSGGWFEVRCNASETTRALERDASTLPFSPFSEQRMATIVIMIHGEHFELITKFTFSKCCI